MTDATLRDGSTTRDRRLDRIVQFDVRSRRYGVVAAIERVYPRSYTWACSTHLDQGQEGACVEFGWVHEMLASPAMVAPSVGRDITSRHAIYWPAQRDDPWEGGSYPGAAPQYEGTSVLAGAKRVKALGYIGSYRWAFGLEETLLAIGRKGPCVGGFNWYEGCFEVDGAGFLRVTGRLMGGHCVLLKGVRLAWKVGTAPEHKTSPQWFQHLDLDRTHVVVHNSWGTDWGNGGDAKMTARDLGRLLAEDGELCVPIDRRSTSTVPLTA